jgi:septal ring factor EnvC (AmiA/AmiB activator)
MCSKSSEFVQCKSGGIQRWGISTLVVMLALMMVVPSLVQAQQSPGFKQTDKLINKAQDTITSIRSTKIQTEATLDNYNAIIDGKVPDNRKAYKALVKDIQKSENQADKVGNKIVAMQEAASTYFGDWETSIEAITSDDLRAKSEMRLKDTRANYDEILKAAQKAGDEFKPFITNLHDQVTFLGHDLNPSAIADLKDEAAALNSKGAKVFSAVDDTIEVASKYTNSLKP